MLKRGLKWVGGRQGGGGGAEEGLREITIFVMEINVDTLVDERSRSHDETTFVLVHSSPLLFHVAASAALLLVSTGGTCACEYRQAAGEWGYWCGSVLGGGQKESFSLCAGSNSGIYLWEAGSLLSVILRP